MVRHAQRLPHYTVTRWQLRRLLTRQNILIADVIILPSLRLIPEPTSQRLWEKWTMRKLQNCHFTAHTTMINTGKTCLFCNISFPLKKNKKKNRLQKHRLATCLTDAWQYIWCYTDISHCHICPTQGWWTMDRLRKCERSCLLFTGAGAFGNVEFCYFIPPKEWQTSKLVYTTGFQVFPFSLEDIKSAEKWKLPGEPLRQWWGLSRYRNCLWPLPQLYTNNTKCDTCSSPYAGLNL